jgi:hypothetical protein
MEPVAPKHLQLYDLGQPVAQFRQQKWFGQFLQFQMLFGVRVAVITIVGSLASVFCVVESFIAVFANSWVQIAAVSRQRLKCDKRIFIPLL